ncbi:FAD/NAD-P-binding domain-containing protein [Polyporus arcularius HHB13444]|uniref:FAD/NAD-P-binding domain-containing protein n=1 Tax=Polyporus arcularius HHB13444 TaxID=1314778 RepID=A0A5C3Q8U1_9APHY|nr:FAD/NAD-P-binding domain-containing protein [Polyporus arcularius HHB13444]
MSSILDESVAVIGAGIAGLINAHVLLRDGFTAVQVLTRDSEPGGTWTADRTYPGLHLNNVHGEYRVSPLDMPPIAAEDGRLSGEDIHNYVQAFATQYLKGKIQYETEVCDIRRHPSGSGWRVEVRDVKTGTREERTYARVVLCTGGCSTAHIPAGLGTEAAASAGFAGMVFHSADFGARMGDLLEAVPSEAKDPEVAPIVVVGGGKSAQDICAYLANEGRKVTMVCPDFDAFTAGPKPLPAFIRKSRLLALFSPHIHLRTSLERFLHTTWLGKKIVDFMWHGLVDSSFKAAAIPADSPLRNTVSPYWHIRVNDEGIPQSNGFHALAVAGKIGLASPARMAAYGEDGRSVILDDGRSLPASAVVLCTGYTSSWSAMFNEDTMEKLGLAPRLVEPSELESYRWDYTTLADAPPLHPDAARWASTLYRGMVPAKFINRDFAVNGAVVSPNYGYTTEIAAHWISSYFLGDDMRLPLGPEDALYETARHAAWLRQRYPQIPTALNGSHTSDLAFWSWPQHADDLLEDMGLPVMRSGGNALTWPFKVVDLSEIKKLKEERDARRAQRSAHR